MYEEGHGVQQDYVRAHMWFNLAASGSSASTTLFGDLYLSDAIAARDRVAAKMTPAQIAEAQRMARELGRLGAPRKSRSECALDERVAPREGSFARPTEPARAPY
jgi:TPR repeat protein